MFSRWICNFPQKSTGSFPWGHVIVVVFILTQGDAQQQRTLCVALTGSSYLTSGRRRWETLGFLSASCCWPGQANRLLLELKLPLFVEVTGVPPVSWVWLPFLRQPRVSHFSGANKLWDSGTPALWSRPLAQQYTQHVVRDTSGGCKWPSLGMPGTGTAKPLWILFSSLCVVIVEEDPILLMSAVRGSNGLGSPGGLMQPDIFWPCFYTLNRDVED